MTRTVPRDPARDGPFPSWPAVAPVPAPLTRGLGESGRPTSDGTGAGCVGAHEGADVATRSGAGGAERGTKPTTHVALLRCAVAGDEEALGAFARWAYGQVRRGLDRPSRRSGGGSPADEAEDDVQTAMVFVLGGLGRCRAENDYQLAAWVDLVAWRGVLRGRLEQRSLDALAPAVGSAARRLPPEALTSLPDGTLRADERPSASAPARPSDAGRGGGSAEAARGGQVPGGVTPQRPPHGNSARGDASRGDPARGAGGLGAGLVDAEVLWRALAAALGVDGRGEAADEAGTAADVIGGGGAHLAAPAVTSGDGTAPTPPLAAVLGRLHAEEVHAFLCRLAVCAYAALPADTQQIFWERLVVGGSWAEVAALVGLAEPAAKRRVERAVRVLSRRVLAYVATLPPAVALVVAAHCRRLGIAVPAPDVAVPGAEPDARRRGRTTPVTAAPATTP